MRLLNVDSLHILMIFRFHPSMAVHEMESCIRGYHNYKDVWVTMIGDLSYEREPLNHVDRYIVAVLKDDTIIRHIPKNIGIYSLFIARGGTVVCTPMGGRRYSADLPQRGLEIPCKLVLIGEQNEVEKVKALFAHKPVNTVNCIHFVTL